MKKLKFIFALLLILGLLSKQGISQDRPIHEVHSFMLYNFMKYIHWPPAAISGDFVIGVIGDDDVYNTLTELYGTKLKGDQSIVIKQFKSAAEVVNCHLVYLGKSKSGIFEDVKIAIDDKPILVVTDKAGLGEKGSGINFKVVDSKLKFELNQMVVNSANLKVSSKLKMLAIMI